MQIGDVMDAQSYYDSLLTQGYSPEQAQQYTAQHYPGFSATPTAPLQDLMQPLAPPMQDMAPTFAEPNYGMPNPSQGMNHMDTAPGVGANRSMVKVLAIGMITLLIVGGVTVGALYATDVLGADEKSESGLVGTWANLGDDTMTFKDDGTIGGFDDEDNIAAAKWSLSGDELTLTISSLSFDCGDDLIPLDWVDDGMDDCYDGSDEGPSQSYIDEHTVEDEIEVVYKYLIKDDVLFIEWISYNGEGMDDESEGHCSVLIRESKRPDSSGEFEDMANTRSPSWCTELDYGSEDDI